MSIAIDGIIYECSAEVVELVHALRARVAAAEEENERIMKKGEDERRCRYVAKRSMEEAFREASTLHDDLKYLLEKVNDLSVERLVKRGCSLAIEEMDRRHPGTEEG